MAASGKEAAICWVHGKQLGLGNFRDHLASAVLVGVPGGVGLRQHSHELVAVDHGQVANLMPLHNSDCLLSVSCVPMMIGLPWACSATLALDVSTPLATAPTTIRALSPLSELPLALKRSQRPQRPGGKHPDRSRLTLYSRWRQVIIGRTEDVANRRRQPKGAAPWVF